MPAKLKRVRKREVVTLREGRQLGRPADVVVDPENHRVSFVVLTRGALPDTSIIIPASEVRSFETDTIAIESLDSLKIAARDDESLGLLKRGLEFQGHRVLSSEGQQLGRIRQVLLDEKGEVVQYRVRRGLIGWLKPSLKIDPTELGTAGGEIAVVRGREAEALTEEGDERDTPS